MILYFSFELKKMKMNFRINMSLLPLKGYYFLLMSAQAAILPYLPIFAQSLGLTTQEVALVYGIFPILIILTNPMFGAISDKLQSHKLVLIILIILQVGFTVPIYYLPKINFGNAMQFALECNQTGFHLNNNTYYPKVTKNQNNSLSMRCDFSCELANINDSIIFNKETNFFRHLFHKENISQERITFRPQHFIFGININDFNFDQPYYSDLKCIDSFHAACIPSDCSGEIPTQNTRKEHDGILITFQFLLFFFFRIISEICNAGGNGIGDSITLEKLKEKPNQFGKTRLMGSLGYGIGSVIFGKLNDLRSEEVHEKDYGIGFYSYAGLLFLSFIILAVFCKSTIPPKSQTLGKDLRKLFLIPQIFGFMLMLAFDGMTHTFLGTFSFWYMKELGASHLNMGMSIFTMCMSEVLFFYFSGYIIKRLDAYKVIYIVFLAWSIRLTMYTFITNPWLFLPVDLLHGICFALFYANLASFAKKVALPGTLATTQEIFVAIWQGVGSGIGSLIGGFSYHRYGAIVTYRSFAVGMLVACISYIIFNFVLNKTEWKSYFKNQADPNKEYDMKVVNGLVNQLSSSSSSSSEEVEQADGLLKGKENNTVDKMGE